MQQEDQSFQSASAYYNKHRKRSFLFSRIAVFGSMLVMILALSLNLSVLNSPQRSDIRSQAASNEVESNTLPKLPKDCVYQQLKDEPIVVCSSPTPQQTTFGANGTYKACQPLLEGEKYVLQCTDDKNQRVTVPLQLPPGCAYETTADSYIIVCGKNTPTN